MSQKFRCQFLKAGRTIDIPEDGIILEHALRAGLDVSFGCQGGSCGTCMVKVVGEVYQWGRCIDEEEIAQGFALICSSYPKSDLIIDG